MHPQNGLPPIPAVLMLALRVISLCKSDVNSEIILDNSLFFKHLNN